MEKMLTDEEIVKALEACMNGKGCEVCPYFEKGIDCIRRSEKDTLDLIHRQKAEIERLTEREKFLENAWKTSLEHTKTVERGLNASEARNAELQKQVDELKAENQRLRTENCYWEDVEGLHEEVNELTARLKQSEEDYKHGYEKAVKDTAKEILTALYHRDEMGFDVIKWFAKAYYGVEVE